MIDRLSLSALLSGMRREQPWRRPLAGESGLQLLIDGEAASARSLRWTTNDDSPLLRPLRTGEVRVLIVACNASSVRRGRSVEGFSTSCRGRTQLRSSRWHTLVAKSVGLVVESRHPTCAVGSARTGQWHVGTHVVESEPMPSVSMFGGESWPANVHEQVFVGTSSAEQAFGERSSGGVSCHASHWVSLLQVNSSVDAGQPILESRCLPQVTAHSKHASADRCRRL